jgi:hypothetical protein
LWGTGNNEKVNEDLKFHFIRSTPIHSRKGDVCKIGVRGLGLGIGYFFNKTSNHFAKGTHLIN